MDSVFPQEIRGTTDRLGGLSEAPWVMTLSMGVPSSGKG